MRNPSRAEVATPGSSPPGAGLKATILLVDDQAAVLLVTRKVLSRLGYTVLEADSGEQAIRVAEQYGGPIDLVLTDVVMPGMSGQTVASEVLRIRPDARVLFMSGYTADVIRQHGALEAGAALLQKPFSPDALRKKISEVLKAGDSRMRP